MSTKHVFSSPDGLVLRGLRGAVAMNPTLRLHEPSKSVYVSEPSPNARVAVIAGGGAGHEPAHASFTGNGMLAASVSGEIFASPSASQLLSTIQLARLSAPYPDSAVLIVCNNYTGDRLNFGLAVSRARAQFPRIKIDIIVNADDVSLLHTKSLVGPRGLGGNIIVCKILGAAAAAGRSFEDIKQLGEAVVGQLASAGVGLEHCHVPGRSLDSFRATANASDVYEIGMGLHNEPGARKGAFTAAGDLVSEMLGMILQSRDNGFIRVGKNAIETDEVVLFVNNLGGISQLEICAVVDETLLQLQSIGIHPHRVYASTYMTSLNAPGFSLSLLNVSAITREVPNMDIYALLDAPTDALAWVGVRTAWPSIPHSRHQEDEEIDEKVKALAAGHKDQSSPSEESHEATASYWRQADVSPAHIEAGIRAACHSVLEVAPELTAFDTVVGDGDCGETFAAGAKAVLQALEEGNMTVKNLSPSELMVRFGDICEKNMGGTIGALLAIFFTSLSTAVPSSASLDDKQTWYKAPLLALDSLSAHTPARPGDRTLVDALRPFADTLASTESLDRATAEARRGAESTRGMTARLGRASYVGKDAMGEKDLPPDPGAWGVMAITEGFLKGVTGSS